MSYTTHKLDDLRIVYAKAPKMLEAINSAIDDYGPETLCCVVQGLPSTRRGSNVRRAMDSLGWATPRYYKGARAGKNRNDGYYIVIVNAPE